MHRLFSLAAVCLLGALSLGCVSMTPAERAKHPVAPTFWEKLGIPQAFSAFADNNVNRFGNHPRLERKPRLLRLADPQNLESPKEVIKVAAEVKQEEDLAPQKIKALKYLGEIGCGCYDADGKVEAAILAGLFDCTPAVRLAALDAIENSVTTCREQCGQRKRGRLGHGRDLISRLGNRGCGCSGGATCSSCWEGDYGACGGCAECDDSACCTTKVREKLADMAFGVDDCGCPKEPVAEIRARAAQVLQCVCPAYWCDPNLQQQQQQEQIEQTPIEGAAATGNHQYFPAHQPFGTTVPVIRGYQPEPAITTLGDSPQR